MRILLDTNILLWTTSASNRLDTATRTMLDQAETVMFSAASIWEIAIKTGQGRADFNVPPNRILANALESGLIELQVTAATAAKAVGLPAHHKDPFDRLLIVQTMAEPAIFLTTDRMLTRYTDLVTLVGRQPS